MYSSSLHYSFGCCPTSEFFINVKMLSFCLDGLDELSVDSLRAIAVVVPLLNCVNRGRHLTARSSADEDGSVLTVPVNVCSPIVSWLFVSTDQMLSLCCYRKQSSHALHWVALCVSLVPIFNAVISGS